jgi:hypothetical protein
VNWRFAAALIVAIEYSAALLVGWSVGFHYPFPAGTFAPAALGVTIFAVSGLALWRTAEFALAGESQPGRRIAGEVIFNWDIPLGVTLIFAQMAVLGWLKVTLPYANGFWADPLLANIDATLFGGTDPWRITHALLGWASPFIDRAYLTWAPLNLLMMLGLLLMRPSIGRNRCLLAWFLIVSVSALTQYLLPSAGPIFYEAAGHGSRFEDLPLQPWVETTRHYLWAGYINPDQRVGSGISAMPSVHVGIACWVALVIRLYLPRLQALGWLFVGVIVTGSVHLGWHYAVDGLAGMAIAILAWKLAAVKLGLWRRADVGMPAGQVGG